MARRNDHSREQLLTLALDAAETLVREHGPSGLTARALARAIGYTPGTLYLVFNNLDDIILHVNARTLDRLYRSMREVANSEPEPVESLRRLARAYIGFAYSDPNLWRLCFEHRLPDDIPGPVWLDERIEQLVALLMAPLRGATGKNDAALGIAAQSLWSGVHGICTLALTHKLTLAGNQPPEQLTDSLVTNYLVGLSADLR